MNLIYSQPNGEEKPLSPEEQEAQAIAQDRAANEAKRNGTYERVRNDAALREALRHRE